MFLDRGIYSVLGAAAVCGSVTRTVSVAMITLELNGHLSHSVALMVCVLSSYATSEMINPDSFFTMLSCQAGLDAKKQRKGQLLVKQVLETNTEYTELVYLSLKECTP